MLLDWENKIVDLCKKFQVDPELYNENVEFKEMVASFFGFPSYESFHSFPDPKSIIDGRGNPLRSEHMMLALALVQDCCSIIQNRFYFDRDQNVFNKQIENLTNYIDENLKDEFLDAAKLILKNSFKK